MCGRIVSGLSVQSLSAHVGIFWCRSFLLDRSEPPAGEPVSTGGCSPVPRRQPGGAATWSFLIARTRAWHLELIRTDIVARFCVSGVGLRAVWELAADDGRG